MTDYSVLAESKVQSDLIESGFTVSLPTEETQYDLVAEKDGDFYSIQVKKGSLRTDTNSGEAVKCNVMRSGRDTENVEKRKYDSGDFDILAMWAKPWDNVCYMAWDEPQYHWTVRKSKEGLSGQGSHRVNIISEYTIERAAKRLK